MHLPENRAVAYLVKLASDKGFIAFWMIFIFYAGYLSTTTYDYLPYDSKDYWTYGEAFFADGKFSFLNYATETRGFLLPLLNLPFYRFAAGTGIELFALIKIMGAFTAGILFGIAVPWLIKNVSSVPEISLVRRLVFALLGLLFWRDHFNFPLSDFPALLALVICFGILIYRTGFGWLIIAGLFFGAALNLRPTYAVCIPLVPVFLWLHTGKENYGKAFLKMMVFFIGFVVISLPQVIINANLKNSFSPLVQAKAGQQNRNLYLSQLEWGLIVQKYETSLDQDFPFAGMPFFDPDGIEFVRENDLAIDYKMQKGSLKAVYGISDDHRKGLKNFGQYFKLVITNPGEFFRIYLKHIFNGFDLQYPSPYIQDIYPVNYGLILANFTVLYSALLIFWFRVRPRLNARRVTLLLLFVAPCLLAIPTAIEVRYFLPLHIMAYATVAFGFSKPGWQKLSLKNKLLLVAGYLIFVGLGFFASYQVQQTLLYKPRYLF